MVMKTSESGATTVVLSEFTWENIKQPGAYIELTPNFWKASQLSIATLV